MIQKLLNSYEEALVPYVKLGFDTCDKYLHVLPITATILYLAMVFYLPKALISSNGKARWKGGAWLKQCMILWNLFLTVASFLMVVGSVVPFCINYAFSGKDLNYTIYDPDHLLFQFNKHNSSMQFWGLVFIYAKYAELLDTLFLILKNPERPVQFLHWYHHTTVLLFSWYATACRYSVGYWFGSINALVHTFMYYYYYRTEMGKRPWWNKPLTIFQISQMVAGIVFNGIWAYEWFKDNKGQSSECLWPIPMMAASALMYGSYLYLFVEFFVKRYVLTENRTAPKKKNL